MKAHVYEIEQLPEKPTHSLICHCWHTSATDVESHWPTLSPHPFLWV